ncbi:elongation factor P [Altererythrobacter sp. H2]|uniref:elongation factor P n=1 Tax=Altererythrobacter sp. H2 TaxID=3108391 RepID=UPI002B4C1410|nr:elongation factor P [Altererythrobacter sp. H2]WRK94888.1 elongation factor P [Altererythrobacter sp. H2]
MIALIAAAAAASPLATAPLGAMAGGKLQTMPQGRYICSLPGDALGKAWEEIPDKDFVIDNGSTYRTEAGTGTYLLTGRQVQFTRGPMKGMAFERISGGTLRLLDENGQPGRVRCVRSAR